MSLVRLGNGALVPALVVVFACAADESAPTPPPPEQPVSIDPAPSPLRRLLASQYVASVDYLLGEEAALAADPPHDPSLNGFAGIAAAQFALNDVDAARYEQSARAVAAAAMGNGARIAELMGCQPEGPGDTACHLSFIERFGRLVWRRPPLAAELDDYLAVAQKGAQALGDFYAGLELSISAMLQSPSFLYQVEIGTGDPDHPGRRRLGGYEVASRMSFFLLGRTPDETLLDAAAAGELDTEEGVRGWATELVAQPGARLASERFFREYLQLDEIDVTFKDKSVFPDYDPALGQSMKGETLRLVDDLLWERREPMGALFTADFTWVDDRLAAHYGALPPVGAQWASAILPAEQGRAGILSHASLLTIQAHPTSTSSLHRGLFVMERFLCETLPPPPDDVVAKLPPSSTAPTLRERLQVHLADPVCRACHLKADGIGLSLEKYDGIGKYRRKENGAPIDASADVPGWGKWDGVKELGALLAGDPEVLFCVLRQVHRYGTGHVELDQEFEGLRAIEKRWAVAGYTYPALLVELAASELFRTVGESQ